MLRISKEISEVSKCLSLLCLAVGVFLSTPCNGVDTVPEAVIESNHVWNGLYDSSMFGSSVASAGDVNGDGFDDLIIGAYGWDTPGGFFDGGAAFVFHGGPNGIGGTDPASADAVLYGNGAHGEFGTSVAGAGDVNGDGFDDIVIGASYYPSFLPGTSLDVDGAAFVFLGSANGIVGFGPATAHARIFGNQIGSYFGHQVSSAGDVNGDGYDDILIGAPRQGVPFAPPVSPNQGSGAGGAALIFHGSASGITGTGFDDADATILPYPVGQPVFTQLQLGAGLGRAGDVNNDGYDDILVGASGYTLVFHGSSSGIVGRDPASAATRIDSTSSIYLSVHVSTAGDVNGDGFSDILLSDPSYPVIPFVSSGAGAVFVFHGSSSGIDVSSPASADRIIEGTGGSLQEFGWRMSTAGDVDGDGYDDIMIGDLEYPGSQQLEGSAYIFSGGPSGVSGTTDTAALVQFTPGQTGAAYQGNRSGFDVAGGADINGDGSSDVFMGAALFDAGQTDEGAVFVYHGGDGSSIPNQPPIASAGDPQFFFDTNSDGFEFVHLNGTGSSDGDGSIVAYQWTSADGVLGSGSELIVSMAVGTTLVTLRVTDDQGSESTDSTTVTIAPMPPSSEFIRGDCTADGSVNISDPIALLDRLFGSAPSLGCEDACDGNDDEALDLADVVLMLEAVFGLGGPLPEPTIGCGLDPAGTTLLCSSMEICP